MSEKNCHIFIQPCVLCKENGPVYKTRSRVLLHVSCCEHSFTQFSQMYRSGDGQNLCLCPREIVSSSSVEGRVAAVRLLHCHRDAAIHLLHLTNGATAECREQRLPQIEFVLSPQESSSRSISPLCTTAMSPSPSPLCCPRWQPSAGKNIRPAASFHTWSLCPTAVWLWPRWTAPTSSALPKGLLLMMVRLWRNNSQLRGGGSREFHLEFARRPMRTRSKSMLKTWEFAVNLFSSALPLCFLRPLPLLGGPHPPVRPPGPVLDSLQRHSALQLLRQLEGPGHHPHPTGAVLLPMQRGPLQVGRQRLPGQVLWGRGRMGVRGWHQPQQGGGEARWRHGVSAGLGRVEGLSEGCVEVGGVLRRIDPPLIRVIMG